MVSTFIRLNPLTLIVLFIRDGVLSVFRLMSKLGLISKLAWSRSVNEHALLEELGLQAELAVLLTTRSNPSKVSKPRGQQDKRAEQAKLVQQDPLAQRYEHDDLVFPDDSLNPPKRTNEHYLG
ncbi:hypothetical protein [Curtobacterium flaccumfaciens]|uniref:hypothetical protein n=1 Tax=Curtobacterium flaccumfaciens TaxID=2035 RepID=UPI001E324DC1|nr:hypothetical protein [Curtobacterium allii]MCE0459684.1 hypothetical protein [Curtobacterium allii]